MNPYSAKGSQVAASHNTGRTQAVSLTAQNQPRPMLDSNVPTPKGMATAQEQPQFWSKRAQDLNQARRAA